MKRGKKAQEVFGMSFSVIFSIILIIFFIIIAFIVVKSFLNSQKCIQIGVFIKEFQPKINQAWNSDKLIFEFSYNLPSNLKYACIANLSDSFSGSIIEKEIFEKIKIYEQEDNLFFYPEENACGIPNHRIQHLDIKKITSSKNPYCIPVINGKIKIQIEKKFTDMLVSLK